MNLYYIGIPTRNSYDQLEGYTRLNNNNCELTLTLFLNFPQTKIVNGFPVKQQTIELT